MKYYLGIDTSNYTTSVAVTDGCVICENIKIPLHVGHGERGLRQSDAVFSHIKNLPAALDKLGCYDLAAIGYSAYPRDNEGSYMPCFEAGATVAKCAASLLSIRALPFSHQAGHVRAAIYSSKIRATEFIAFHVSGGTTELLHVKNQEIILLGGTLDISAGQAVDRIGVALGIDFPCGPQMEKLAGDIPVQNVRTCVRGLKCNISGLENQAKKMIEDGKSKEIIAAYTFDFITSTLEVLTKNALSVYNGLPVLYAGGVMSNSRIRLRLEKEFHAYFAEPQFSSDNASGCALLCADAFTGGTETV